MRRGNDTLGRIQLKSRAFGCRDGQLSRSPDPIWEYSAGNGGQGFLHQAVKNSGRIVHERLRQRGK
jgi:hypothetical protein